MLFGVENLDVYLVLGILIVFGLLEVIAGHLHTTKRTRSDWIQEMGGFFALSVLIKPMIVLSVMGLGQLLVPQYANLVGGWSLLLMLPFYLFPDDILQYW